MNNLSFSKNPLRNMMKDIYYKYIYYRIPIKWEKDYLEASFGNGKKIKLVYSIDKNSKYYSSKYYSAELISILKDAPGYFKNFIPKEGDYVIDGGAYEGGMTILLSRLVGEGGRVFAFEPWSPALKNLKKNLELNNINNVIIIEKGIYDHNCSIGFEEEDVGSKISESSKNKIEVVSLDSWIKKEKIDSSKITFVKTDIEGAEIEAIRGAKELIEKYSPNFAMASYHIVNGKKSCYQVEKEFKNLGYSIKTGYPKHLTTWGWKK